MAQHPRSAIGILGGSFDPVHSGHLAIAQLAFEHFSLDRVILIPAHIQPHKRSAVCAPPRHRLGMLRAAANINRSFRVCDIELARGGTSFTVDTLHAMKKAFPGRELFFIIGSDNLREIHTWHRHAEILSMVTLCVTHRPGYSIRVPGSLQGARVRKFPSPRWAISSTEIRDLLGKGHSCRYLLPDRVRAYIHKHALYC